MVNEALDWNLQVNTMPGGRTELRVAGELDLDTSPYLLAEFERVIADHHPTEVVIDLSDLVFVDSSGLGTLVACWRRAERARVAFSISNLCEDVALSLEITGLTQILPIRQLPDAA